MDDEKGDTESTGSRVHPVRAKNGGSVVKPLGPRPPWRVVPGSCVFPTSRDGAGDDHGNDGSSTTGIATSRPGLWGTRGWPWVGLLLGVAVLGFWKPYFSQLGAAQGMAHLHAASMLAWIGMLVAQPLLIRSRRPAWHRRIGKASYAVVPLIVASALALAQQRIGRAPPEMLPMQQFVLFLGVSMAILFAIVWGLGVRYRNDSALHARYMGGTVLTLIDPSLVRVLIFWVPSVPPPFYQLITFGVVYAILALLIFLDRKSTRGRSALWVLLGLFVTLHALIMTVPGTQAWQRFAVWYAGL
jgi:hypothetical protein